MERKFYWCPSRAHDCAEVKRVRIYLAVDFMTMATSTGARHVLVVMDLFTIYSITVPLMSTDSVDVVCGVVENWVLKIRIRKVSLTDQGKSFVDKLIPKICQLWVINNNQTFL